MGTPLVIGIVIYLVLIIALTVWFLRIHLQKSLTDMEHHNPLPLGPDAVNLENQSGLCESVVQDDATGLRSTETDSFPKKK